MSGTRSAVGSRRSNARIPSRRVSDTYMNPKPRRTHAAGASSCRVSQGGWEGRDTGTYLRTKSRQTRERKIEVELPPQGLSSVASRRMN